VDCYMASAHERLRVMILQKLKAHHPLLNLFDLPMASKFSSISGGAPGFEGRTLLVVRYMQHKKYK